MEKVSCATKSSYNLKRKAAQLSNAIITYPFSGIGVLGRNEKQQNRISSLARLVSSQNDFNDAFKTSVDIDQKNQNMSGQDPNLLTQSNRSSNSSRMGTIMEGSRQFKIGSREFTFDENDPIFLMTGPTT